MVAHQIRFDTTRTVHTRTLLTTVAARFALAWDQRVLPAALEYRTDCVILS